MDITPYVDRLRHELGAVAEAGGPEVRAAAERLTLALDPAVRLTILEAVSQAAAEISTLVPSGSIDVRLRGRDAEFVVDVPPPPPQDAPTPQDAAPSDDTGEDGDVVRITLRLPESVKTKAEELAARSGRSLNGWIVTALRTATRDRGATFEFDLGSFTGDRWGFGSADTKPTQSGRRMSGWV
jgi:hypothetical protein